MARVLSIEFTVTPFHDDAGKIIGIAAIMRDVTKRFEEMKALRQRAPWLKRKSEGHRHCEKRSVEASSRVQCACNWLELLRRYASRNDGGPS